MAVGIYVGFITQQSNDFVNEKATTPSVRILERFWAGNKRSIFKFLNIKIQRLSPAQT